MLESMNSRSAPLLLLLLVVTFSSVSLVDSFLIISDRNHHGSSSFSMRLSESSNAQDRLQDRLSRINQQANQFPAAAPVVSMNTPDPSRTPTSTAASTPSRYSIRSMQETVEARRLPANQVSPMVNNIRKNRASMKSARQWPFAMATSGEKEPSSSTSTTNLQASDRTGITLQRGRPTGSPTYERAMLPFAGYVDEGGAEVFILQPAYHERRPLLLSEQWDKATSFLH